MSKKWVPSADDLYLPNDPNKGIPIKDLLAKNGGDFTAVVEKKDWFDSTAKPRPKKLPESEFVPDPNIKDVDNGNI